MSNIQVVIPSEAISSYLSPSDKIVITGEFDDWQHSDYVLQYAENVGYKVEIPRLRGKERALFKFLVNDSQWMTLSYFETLTDDSGITNNVMHYEDFDFKSDLDNVTISSIFEETEQQKQLLSYATKTPACKFLPAELLQEDNMESNPSPSNQNGINDYVNISSHGELSSIEDLDFEPYESDLEETIQYDSGASFGANQRPLNGLVSIVKKARTYWHS